MSDENYKGNPSNVPTKTDILHIVKILLCSIIFILAIIGNGLVIWIAGFRMKKTIGAVWFLNLAIAALLSCASLLLYILQNTTNMCSVSSGAYCALNIILWYITMSASVLLLTTMSIDRWVSVMWPLWVEAHRTGELVRITAALAWVLSLVLTAFIFLLYSLFNYHDFILQTIYLIRLVIMFVIPFLIIFTSYVMIVHKLRNSNRPPRSQRPYRIITAVVLCFFICWLPYYIWPLTSMYDRHDFQYEILDSRICILAYLNSCINPIIYVSMGGDTGPSFLRSIPSRIERALSEHIDDPCREEENYEPYPTTNSDPLN